MSVVLKGKKRKVENRKAGREMKVGDDAEDPAASAECPHRQFPLYVGITTLMAGRVQGFHGKRVQVFLRYPVAAWDLTSHLLHPVLKVTIRSLPPTPHLWAHQHIPHPPFI